MLKEVIDNDAFFEVVQAELKSNKVVSFKVKGTSMNPFYTDSETIVFVETPTTLNKYDVVLAHYQGMVILHRIIKVSGNKYTLRGDSTFRKEVVTKNDIFGKVIKHHNQKDILENSINYRFKVFLWTHNPLRKLFIRWRSK